MEVETSPILASTLPSIVGGDVPSTSFPVPTLPTQSFSHASVHASSLFSNNDFSLVVLFCSHRFPLPRWQLLLVLTGKYALSRMDPTNDPRPPMQTDPLMQEPSVPQST